VPADNPTRKEAAAGVVNLMAKLREIETENITVEIPDLPEIREELALALKGVHDSRFRLGEAIVRYKEAVPRGCWARAEHAFAVALETTDRTVRNIMADFRRIESTTPAEVIEAFEEVGIDAAKKCNANLVEMTVKVVEEKKVEPSVAIPIAKASLPVRSSLHTGKIKLTEEERMILDVRLAIRHSIAPIPPNLKLEYFQRAAAIELKQFLSDGAEPFTITITPTVDLAARKRPAA
jgi:hypothetical protein